MSAPPAAERPASFGARLRDLARRALLMELRVYESLWRAIARRPKLAAGSMGFRYHRPVLTALIVFLVLSAVEIPIIDMIVHRWVPVRIGFLILGIWGLTWMVGLLCAYLTRPHAVGAEGIRVREGLELDLLAPWREVAEIRAHRTSRDPSDPDRERGRVFDEDGSRVCAIRIGNETNLEIVFERPFEAHLPGLPPKGGPQPIDRLRFWADDPDGLLRAAGEAVDR
ncbi:hypothetical protein J4H92_11730 [Leucobacter weissii]|uniref:PH domain-containing protein n=1 Tax=Leucobacter weissii TaxID=1983706 RepID=A0A939MKV2_9MICO|nr:hypothetical protein [Leucobacter weissii]MBO1902618.1 hypothetical protein [Leucobacter weissii]